ncbi:TOBE domain-containing protein [Streptomyces sp. NPDC056525]|uniref:TOBE domain-containing protein n=1 Tax=unclassified Streptomyces TaxID=2593676 RepID=UPI00368727D7
MRGFERHDTYVAAAITTDAVRDLGLAEGSAVEALVKSTEISPASAWPRAS